MSDPSVDLCTVAAVQAALGLQASTDTALLDGLVTAVSDWMVSECSRHFLEDDYELVDSGRGGATLVLPEGPVTDVNLVSVDGRLIPMAPDDRAPGFTFDADAVYLRGHCFTRGVRNVRVGYTAGWPAGEVPQRIVQTAIELTGLLYKQKDRPDVAAKTIAGEVVTYLQTAMTPRARRVLDMYSRAEAA